MGGPVKINRRLQSGDRRDQIIQAALKLIGEKGVGSLTTSALARAADISEANLYRHFKSKNEILFETGKAIGSAIRKNLETVLGTAERPIAKLRRAFLLHLEFFEQNEGIPRLGLSEEMHVQSQKLKDEFLQNIKVYSLAFETIIKEGQQDDVIRQDLDARSTAAMLVGLVQFTVTKWSLTGFSFSLASEGLKLWRNFERCIRPEAMLIK